MSTQIRRGADYGTRSFDLSDARTLERIDVRADTFAVLEADDSATIRLNHQDAAPIDVRNLSSMTIPPTGDREVGIERIYLSNDPGTGRLTLLFGFAGTSGTTEPPARDEVDLTDREAREVGKIRVQDSNGVLLDPASDDTLTNTLNRAIQTWNAGTLPIQEDNPLDVSAAAVSRDMPSILTDTTTGDGAANAASVQLGTDRSAFDVAYDLAAESTVTVEVSSDATTWRHFKTVTDTEGTLTEDTAFEHVRAYADANVTAIEISAKGV